MNSENDEKKLIEEEQAILDRIVSDMDKVSDSLDRSAEKYIEEWRSSKETGLGESYAVILHAKKGLQNIRSEKKQLYQARDELYDTRAEVYIGDDKEKTYISCKSIILVTKIIVERSVCQQCRDKCCNGITYESSNHS